VTIGETSLFISPHFDDVALSCGGTVARQAQIGRAVVTTVFAGKPTGDLNRFARFQHDRWGAETDAVAIRRREDSDAMTVLGADYRWLDFPDAIYRDSLYLTDEDLFGTIKAADVETAIAVGDAIISLVEEIHPRALYLPLSVGGHVDHRMCQNCAPRIRRARTAVWFYEDFPYCVTAGAVESRLSELDERLVSETMDVTLQIDSRIAAVAAYATQVPTIFRHHGPSDQVIRGYSQRIAIPPIVSAERFWRFQEGSSGGD
jgi:LmbE family N-acetylglucosaminyl deacetylase